MIGLILLMLMCGFINTAIAQKKELPVPGEVFEIRGCTAFVILPETRINPNEPIPWVWYASTLSDLPGKEETWMFQKILGAGIAIAGIDVGESMGNRDGIQQYSFLYSESLLSGKRLKPG